LFELAVFCCGTPDCFECSDAEGEAILGILALLELVWELAVPLEFAGTFDEV
jgi:hypothetical protein